MLNESVYAAVPATNFDFVTPPAAKVIGDVIDIRHSGTAPSALESAAAEWSKCVAFINANIADDSPEELEVVKRQGELEAFLSETPARTFGDLRAKALVIKELAWPKPSYVAPFDGDDIETLTWSLLKDIAGDGQIAVAQAHQALPTGSLDDAELIQAAASMADLVQVKLELQQAEEEAIVSYKAPDKSAVRAASAAVGWAGIAVDELHMRVASLRAGSLQGAAAKLQVMRLDRQGNGYNDPTTAIIMTLSDDFERMATPAVDPALVAISHCRSAMAAYEQACKDSDQDVLDEPPEVRAAARTFNEAWRATCAAKPTTLAGVTAFAAYAIKLSNEMGAWDYLEQAMAALAGEEA